MYRRLWPRAARPRAGSAPRRGRPSRTFAPRRARPAPARGVRRRSGTAGAACSGTSPSGCATPGTTARCKSKWTRSPDIPSGNHLLALQTSFPSPFTAICHRFTEYVLARRSQKKRWRAEYKSRALQDSLSDAFHDPSGVTEFVV
jgi:hypothetical protein